MPQFFDDSGVATAEFTSALPGMLGRETMTKDDGTADKTFDDITSVKSLVQNVHGLKKLTGEQATKIGKGLFPPGDDASEEDKAVFRASQLTALGHPATPADYKFPEPPEGRQYAEGEQAKWADFAHKAGVPQDILTAFVSARHAEMVSDEKAEAEAAETARTTAIEAIEKDPEWLGDKKAENLRIIYNAILKFGDDNLKASIKEAGLFDKQDMKEWTDLVGISSIPFILEVGREMKVGSLPAGEITQQHGTDIKAAAAKAGVTEAEMVKMKALYDKSPEMFE